MDYEMKTIVIMPASNKDKESKNTNKKITYEKKKKMRVETKTWGLNDDDLTYEKQLNIINTIKNNIELTQNHDVNLEENIIKKDKEKDKEKDKYYSLFISHIKAKICGYKQQDIIKNKYNESEFVSFENVINLLSSCNLKCHYCSHEMYILYEIVREMKQWSLDRINNDIGHNKNNLVIACLECNLKRRRTNKDSFMFTKNMKIIREGINDS